MLAWPEGPFKPPDRCYTAGFVRNAGCRRPRLMSVEMLPWGLLAWIALVVLAAGLIQGALGFGFPFVATPLIAMVTDMRTAIVAVLLPTLAVVLVALFVGGSLRATLARFWMMPLYMIVGATAGTSLFVAAPNFSYTLVLS